MRKLYLSLFIICILTFLYVKAENDIRVENKKIYVDDKEYIVKGIAYRPIPLGIRSMDEDGWGGGGLCSAKLSPFDEWKSACFDFDVYDGSPSSDGREPSGPSSWFSGLWHRDFPIIKDLGVNTLRIYSANAITKAAAEEAVESGWLGITTPYGKSHVEFMDLAESSGFKVMFPLVPDYYAFTNDTDEDLQKKFDNIIEEVGNHNALLMWVIGHEWGLESEESGDLKERVKNMITYTRNKMEETWNRTIPITYCSEDDPRTFSKLVKDLGVDIFCANSGYRDNLTQIFDGIEISNYPGWTSIANETNIPFLFGEFGKKGDGTQTNTSTTWFSNKWDSIVKSIDDGCVGGVFFEYNDNLYSNSEFDMTQMGVTYFKVSVSHGQNSTEENVFWADDVEVKEKMLDAMTNGEHNGKSINYLTDIFEYIGRNQSDANTPISPEPITPPTLEPVIPPTLEPIVGSSASKFCVNLFLIFILTMALTNN